ncbi:MAG: ATP-binding protein, partial [Elusimicrobiota bacterium]|nr:ATP-binding protein [Elusimicrobiota bacterium]
SRLSGGLVHDFNNMLTPILTYCDLIMANDDPEQKNEYAAQIKKAAVTAKNLVSQLQAFSRKQSVTPVIFDINNIIEQMKPMLKTTIGEDIKLDFNLSDSVCSIKAGKIQIEQVLMNMLINASHAVKRFGHIKISTSRVNVKNSADIEGYALMPLKTGNYIVIEIRDNGHGINKKDFRKIFEPYHSTKKEKGSGLGLFMVHNIISSLHGGISIQSVPGKKTIFRLYIPAVK